MDLGLEEYVDAMGVQDQLHIQGLRPGGNRAQVLLHAEGGC
jgi:hypothetical protein